MDDKKKSKTFYHLASQESYTMPKTVEHRNKEWISWGAGPRASQYLVLGAKTRAIMDGRPTPDINDIQAVAKPTLRHRIVTNFNAEAEGVSSGDIVAKLISETKSQITVF